ncbi:MAG: hypothetical protein A2W91_00220 [Bacteroidetes bacterium GWF2_38_335]|nr:MAG: hypothetical protein A2W91_00220 [Bacteroidetes bacterium GWF2_38_335]OFY78259.1 MAG: hypothetical protein A2281_03600 [Bacteroidetes bacterium RIFOXYA12_FULL_38_20]HBS87548.1 hypothetical protein [Bacteroidales bacterium]
MKWIAVILLLIFFAKTKGQSGLANSGLLTVYVNTSLTCKGAVSNMPGGNIYNAGTIYLYGNLDNQSTQPLFWQSFQNHRGNIVFLGNLPQIISGNAPVKFTRATVSNLSGVYAQIPVYANDSLGFFMGSLFPGSNQITFERYTIMGVTSLGALANETDNSRVSGLDCSLRASDYVIFPGTTNVAGMGFTVNSDQTIVGLDLLRSHERQGAAADSGIYRSFTVSGGSFSFADLNSLKLNYHSDEFEELHTTEEDFRLWYSDDEGTSFQKITSTWSPGFVYSENTSLMPGLYTISDEKCRIPPACNIFGDNVICEGDPVQLFASETPVGKRFYHWYSPDLPITENDQWELDFSWEEIAESHEAVVYLTITDTKGCENTDSVILDIRKRPDATFSFSQYGFCQNEPVNFSGPPGMDTYEWTMNDEILNTHGSFSQNFSVSGNFPVTLIVDSNGCQGSYTKVLRIFQNPVAALEINGNCTGENVLMTNTSFLETESGDISFYQTEIDFGDGQTASFSGSPETINHVYTGSGEYEILFSVTTNQGCTDSYSELKTINEKIHLTITSENVCLGDTSLIELSIETGYFNFSWDFGDGSDEYFAFDDNIIGHPYEFTGNFSVSVICSAPGYCSDTAFTAILIKDLPVAEFTAGNACLGENSVFTPLSSEVEIVSSVWDFGDGNTSVEGEPEHLFGEPGFFLVTHSVDGINGCSASSAINYEVYELPEVILTGENVCHGDTATFSCGTAESENLFLWDFGDGNQVSQPYLPGITHCYSDPGVYEVELTVTAQNGCVFETFSTAIVVANPVIPINENLVTCTSSIVADAGNPGAVFLWSTGESSQSVTLNENGNYWVLVAETTNACKSLLDFTLELNSEELIDLGADLTSCDSALIDAGFFADYLWNNGATDQVNVIEEGGNYSVTVTDINGCVDFDSLFVTIYHSPAQMNEITEEACFGDTILFSADFPEYTLLWNTGASTPVISVTEIGDYFVTVTGEGGCTTVSEAQHAIFYELPEDPGLADSAVCNSVILSTENPGCLFVWNTGETTPQITVYETGLYSLTVETMNGCMRSDSAYITVVFSPDLNAGADVETCYGNNVMIGPADIVPGSTYSWNNGADSPIIEAETSGAYVLTRTDTTGCTQTDAVLVEIFPVPVADFGDSAICSDAGLLLEVPDDLAVQWYDSSGFFSDENEITIFNPGEYAVNVTNGFGCTSADTFFINHTPFVISPQFLVSSSAKAGDTLQFVSVTHPLPGFFLWNFGDGCTSSLEDPTHVYYMEGEFLITMTIGSEGCAEVYEKNILISGFNKYLVQQLDSTDDFHAGFVDFISAVVYPNPGNGEFFLETELTYPAVQHVIIFDLAGHVIAKSTDGKASRHFEKYFLQNNPSGFYILKVTAGNKSKVFKIIKT